MLTSHIRLLVFLSAIELCSCDVDLFGSDTKKIGSNYRLVKVDWPGEFEFSTPDGKRREAVAELGWQKPLIIVRPRAARDWHVIDTAKAEWTTISDERRRAESHYATIQIHSATEAWNLPRRERRW